MPYAVDFDPSSAQILIKAKRVYFVVNMQALSTMYLMLRPEQELGI